jgi:hypothetical protein
MRSIAFSRRVPVALDDERAVVAVAQLLADEPRFEL